MWQRRRLHVELFGRYHDAASSMADNPRAVAATRCETGGEQNDRRAVWPRRDAHRASRAKERIAERGVVYRVLQAMTRVIMLDVALFGRMRSGPFFALLVKRSE